MHILISLFDFFCDLLVFQRVLFSLHMLEFLIVVFFPLWLIYNLTALLSEMMLGMNCFFELSKARFMAQDVIYPGEGSMCA